MKIVHSTTPFAIIYDISVRKQFEELGIQPITLKDKSEIEELKFVL
jgi:hypothetical protein